MSREIIIVVVLIDKNTQVNLTASHIVRYLLYSLIKVPAYLVIRYIGGFNTHVIIAATTRNGGELSLHLCYETPDLLNSNQTSYKYNSKDKLLIH